MEGLKILTDKLTVDVKRLEVNGTELAGKSRPNALFVVYVFYLFPTPVPFSFNISCRAWDNSCRTNVRMRFKEKSCSRTSARALERKTISGDCGHAVTFEYPPPHTHTHTHTLYLQTYTNKERDRTCYQCRIDSTGQIYHMLVLLTDNAE